MDEATFTVDPWQIDETAFPARGSPRDQLRFCLNYAVLAPSIYNTQPWLFRLSDGTLELLSDRRRALSDVDPDGRERVISCGAALKNLRIAANHFGREVRVQYFPSDGEANLLARLQLGHAYVADYQDEAMFHAISQRRTYRHAFRNRAIPRSLQRRLIWLASEYGCWLHVLDEKDERRAAASLIQEAHQRQLADIAVRAERAAWTNRRHKTDLDGIAAGRNSNVTPPVQSATGEPAHSKSFSAISDRLPNSDDLLAASPVLIVLGTVDDDPASWLDAGQAMQQILLRSTSEGISGSFLNQPCEVPEMREELRKLTGRTGPPQLVLRLGYGSEIDPTPRRPVDEVLISHTAHPNGTGQPANTPLA